MSVTKIQRNVVQNIRQSFKGCRLTFKLQRLKTDISLCTSESISYIVNVKLQGKFDQPITSQSTEDNADVPVAGKLVKRY